MRFERSQLPINTIFAVLLSLLQTCLPDGELIIVQEVVRNLARGGGFAVLRGTCDLEKFTLDAAITPVACLHVGRYPKHLILLICDRNINFTSEWYLLYLSYIRDYGPQYFSVIDATNRSKIDLETNKVVASPFSYLKYNEINESFKLFVDSDFHGSREPWTAFNFSRREIVSGEVNLNELMLYRPNLHDGKMHLYVTKELKMFITPKYPTNYSEPGRPVHAAQSGVVSGITLGHYPHAVPVGMDNLIAIVLNPRVINNYYILARPFRAEIWALIFGFSIVVAVIMTFALRYSSGGHRIRRLIDNIIFTFCQMFTTVKLPSPNEFRFRTAAIVSVLWTVLCLIPLTGYRGSLASLLQKPPHEPPLENISFMLEANVALVFANPNLELFVTHLRDGGFWADSAMSANFLLSKLGLTNVLYTTRLYPARMQTVSIQCLGKHRLVFYCRGVQRQMRILYEANAGYYSFIQGYRVHFYGGNYETSNLSRRERLVEDPSKSLTLDAISPFFIILAVGYQVVTVVVLAEVCFLYCKRKCAPGKSLHARHHYSYYDRRGSNLPLQRSRKTRHRGAPARLQRL